MLRVVTLGGLSVSDSDRVLGRAVVQPRRLALLAVLARAGERGISRGALVALFWPDDDDRARRALNQALYSLRRDLGDDQAIVGTQELRLDLTRLSVDVAEYVALAKRGRLEEAAALYTGPFLAGFHVAGLPAFMRWVEEERRTLERDHARLLERIALLSEREGDAVTIAARWRALAAAEPLDARVAVRLMTALDAAGDRAGALQHARIYEALVRQELDVPPDRAVVALAERLRDAPATVPAAVRTLAVAAAPGDAHPAPVVPAPPPSLSPPPATVAAPAPAPAPAPARPRRRRTRWVVAGAIAALVVVGALQLRAGRPPVAAAAGAVTDAVADGPPTIAVGLIADFRGESAGPARPLADMLATNLARADGIRVVSPARIHELLRQLGATDTVAGGFIAAARQAGAGELVDGTLYARPDGTLRLDLRRVDVASGAVRAALTLEGRDLFALADSGTARLLVGGFGVAGVQGSVADVTTRSEAAYRDYAAGVRLFAAGERDSARALLDAALRQDSAFAAAAYYRAMLQADRADQAAGLTRAVRLAERASERERLLIRARWANYLAVAAGRAVADSLVARYPAEVEGYLLAGLARVDAAEWAAARPLLARAAAMDSLSLRPGPAAAPCTACAALRAIAYSYQAEGLGAEAVRAAQQWTRLQPHGVGAWTTQGELLAMNGRYDEGRAALDSAIARDPRGAGAYALSPLVRLEIRSGRLAEAERLARGRVGVGSLAEHGAALWMLNFTLRNQGRAREAVEAARAYRAVRDSLAGGVAYSAESYMLGASLALAGRARESAAVFDSAARGLLRAGEDPASLARVRPLALTELAWAHYLAGDTAALAPLADRIEAASAGHAWRMAQAAHHQARGLQRAARGDALGAAAEWRAAVTSVLDHPRAKLLLGRALTRAGRPAEAVAALRPALGGWIDAMGAVPVAEVHEALAEAWTQVPGPAARDSAAAHWRFVADAWQHGDPPFAARAAAARRRLAAGP